MKISSREIKKETPKVESFPLMRKHIHSGYVVLFFDETSGMVIKEGNSRDLVIGDYNKHWEEYYDRSIWEEYTGTITVTFEG